VAYHFPFGTAHQFVTSTAWKHHFAITPLFDIFSVISKPLGNTLELANFFLARGTFAFGF